MKRAVFGLVLLTFAACGGGSNAVPAPPSAEDVLYEKLMDLTRRAEKEIRGASDWNAVLAEVTYAKDGRDALFALAKDYLSSEPTEPSIADADDFIQFMKAAKEDRAREADMTTDELSDELATTQPFADLYAELTVYDSIAALAPRDGSSKGRKYAVGRLLDEMSRRVRLLCYAGEMKEAASELVSHLGVLQRLDSDSGLHARMFVNGALASVLIELAQGALQPIADSKVVETGLEPFFEFGNTARKRAWLREFKYNCAFIVHSPRGDLMRFAEQSFGDRLTGLSRIAGSFACELDIALAFDGFAPDLLNADDFAVALGLAKAQAAPLAEKVFSVAYQEARWKAAWLGYRLSLAARDKLLKPDAREVVATAGKYPGIMLRWYDDRLEVGIDPDFPPAREMGYGEVAPVVTIPLTKND